VIRHSRGQDDAAVENAAIDDTALPVALSTAKLPMRLPPDDEDTAASGADDGAPRRPLGWGSGRPLPICRAQEHAKQMSTIRARSAAGRRIISVRRTLYSAGLGISAGGVAGIVGAPELTPLASWTVAVVVLLTRVWRICWRMDSDDTERLIQDLGRLSPHTACRNR